MTGARLDRWASFQRPIKSTDADGNPVRSYVEVFSEWVNLRHLLGGESVMASRMAARSPAILTFMASPQARQVSSEWRIVIDGRTYDAKEHPRETADWAYFEMLVEGGVNAGR